MLYKVKIQDVDGSSSRTYKSLAGAVKRFEEMVGPVEGHINEMHYDLADAGLVMPSIECLPYIRGVGMFGNVASITAADFEAEAAAKAAWSAKGVGKPPAPQVDEAEDLLDNFNYVGSRHHY